MYQFPFEFLSMLNENIILLTFIPCKNSKRTIAIKLLTESASGKVLGREVIGVQSRKYFRAPQESRVASQTGRIPIIFKLVRNAFIKACTHTIFIRNCIATVF